MPITSLVVECVPGKEKQAARHVAAVPMTEVCQSHENFFVVVLETPDKKSDRKTVEAVNNQPGVISAVPVYTNC